MVDTCLLPSGVRHIFRAAGGAGSDGGVDVKMLAEQNVQLKEALKRLHTHSVAEKTEVRYYMRSISH